jgi:hypothetical protein
MFSFQIPISENKLFLNIDSNSKILQALQILPVKYHGCIKLSYGV